MIPQRRIGPVRSTLSVEALEDRTLLTGPNGIVTAMLNAKNGVLMIQGDGGNNSIKILPSPLGGGLLRVAGQPFTALTWILW